MSGKRFWKKAGYNATVQALLNGKSFISGMKRESLDNQTLELLCQFEICRREHGYDLRYCHAVKHCIGVPFCSKREEEDGER